MERRRSAFLSRRGLLRAGLSAVLVVTVLLILLRILAATPIGHSLVESRIEAMRVRGQSVALEGLRGDLLGRFSVETVRLSDDAGVWADVSGVEASWSPLALIRGHLALKTIDGEVLNLSRRPALAPASRKADTGKPLIRGYSLEQLRLGEINLSEGAIGPKGQYRGKAGFSYLNASGALSVELTPIDSGEDRAFIDLSWGQGAPVLGDLAVEAAPNGPLATLFGIRKDTSLSASLKARHQNGIWSADARSQAGDQKILDMSASLADNRFSGSGVIDLAPLARFTALSGRLGGPATFDLRLDQTGIEQPLRIKFDAPHITVRLNSLLVYDENVQALKNIALSVSGMDAAALSGQAALKVERGEITGEVSRSGGKTVFEGKVRAPKIFWGASGLRTAELAGTFSLSDNQIGADAALTANKLVGLPPSVRGPLNTRFTGLYDLDTNRLVAERLAISTEGLQAQATGTLSAQLDADVTGSLHITAPARLPLTGAVDWRLRGHAGTLSGQFDGQSSLTTDNPDLRTLLGEQARFSGTLARAETGALSASDLHLQGGLVTLKGDAQYDQGSLALEGTARTKAGFLRGARFAPINARLSLSGPVSGLAGTVSARTNLLDVAGQKATEVRLASALSLGGREATDIRLAAQVNGQRTVISTAAIGYGEHWRAQGLKVRYGDLAFSGEAAGHGIDPAQLEALFQISGQLPGHQGFDGHLTYKAQTLSGVLAARKLAYGPLEIDTAKLQVGGSWPEFSAALDLTGQTDWRGVELPITAQPVFRFDLNKQIAEADIAADWGGEAIRSTAPVRLNFGAVPGLEAGLTGFGGAAHLSGDMTKENSKTSLVVSDIDLSRLAPLIGRPSLRGIGTADVALFPAGQHIEGNLNLALTGIARGPADAPSADITLTGALEGEVLELRVSADDDDDGLDLTGMLDLPLDTSWPKRRLSVSQTRNANLSLSGRGDIAPLWSLFGMPEMRAEGYAVLNLSDSAPVADLRPTGRAVIRNGLFEDGQTGLMIKDIVIAANLTETAIEVSRLVASGSQGGQLKGAGQYAYDGSGQIAIQLDELNAFRRGDLRAAVSGNLAIGRTDRRTSVTGDLQLDEAHIDLSQLPGRGYATLDIRFEDEGLEEKTRDEAASPVQLDLQLRADRRLYIAGPGLESEWSLDASLKGRPSNPQLSGSASIVRGEADLIGQRFRIREGLIRFEGGIQDTQLQISAGRSADDLNATIKIAGSLFDPDITLSSEPQLPDDEVLSRVLFGRSATQLSPLQAARMAGAAATLSGGSSFDLFDPVEAAIGLDRLDIGLSEDGTTTVSTGRYIASDLYLEIETGITGAPGVAVEWTPFDNVELDATIDPELGPKLAIQWKRDFDTLPGEPKDNISTK